MGWEADLGASPSSPSCRCPSVESSWPMLCPFWLSEAAVLPPSPSPPPVQLLALHAGMEMSSSRCRIIRADGQRERERNKRNTKYYVKEKFKYFTINTDYCSLLSFRHALTILKLVYINVKPKILKRQCLHWFHTFRFNSSLQIWIEMGTIK